LQKGKPSCERQLLTAAFMRVLTYCVTAAPGAAQTLWRGFASVCHGADLRSGERDLLLHEGSQRELAPER